MEIHAWEHHRADYVFYRLRAEGIVAERLNDAFGVRTETTSPTERFG